MRNHPYLSYKSDNVLNPPAPRNFNSPHASSSSRPSLEDALSTFIQRQCEQNQKFESMFTRLDEEVRETKSHITRLTNSLSGTERGKLPSQTQPNPINQNLKIGSKDKHDEVKVVTTLRSGKEIDKSAPLITKKSKETPVEEEKVETKSLGLDDIEKCPIPPPFPQALKLPRKLDTTSDILEHLYQVKINLPLLHVIKQMPAYAKVIKNLCTIKRKHYVGKTAFLTKQVSVVIQHKNPPKYKDPGCPTISCTIGDYIMEHALLDLGASVNLISFSVYQKLGLGELKPTSVTLQLADRSVREPRGMLRMCWNGRMQLTFGSMTLELNIFHVAKQPHEDDDCSYVNLLKVLEGQQVMEINEGMRPRFEELPRSDKKPVPSSEEAPQLKLKLLPSGLKYAYLGPGKLKTKWDDPFIVREVFNHEAVVLEDPRDGRILKVNGQRLKPYLRGVIPEEETMSLEIPTYWNAT
ncbi:uncharacterized protein LOC142625560 [Castanea sativa]|uniref:uncharacterized protein LOC142625560 n=1 Tax=Castanea sativa TaxID=21020 RepID=UPI003F64D565